MDISILIICVLIRKEWNTLELLGMKYTCSYWLLNLGIWPAMMLILGHLEFATNILGMMLFIFYRFVIWIDRIFNINNKFRDYLINDNRTDFGQKRKGLDSIIYSYNHISWTAMDSCFKYRGMASSIIYNLMRKV